MSITRFAISFLLFVVLHSAAADAQTILSPDGRFRATFKLIENGVPTYQLEYKGEPVIRESRMALETSDVPSFINGFSLESYDTSSFDETWEPVLGEVKQIRSQYRELAVTLMQYQHNRTMVIRFRLFNDGLGFRYEFPAQPSLSYFTLLDERTEFNLTGDHKAFWLPGDYDRNEYLYTTTPLSRVDATKGMTGKEIEERTVISPIAVQSPLMLKSAAGQHLPALYINIFEAALSDYPAMNLMVDSRKMGLLSHLVPNALGTAAYLQTPARSPWRTVIVSERAEEILSSRTILNLNEPSVIADPRWIKPVKYVGLWWELHVGRSTWRYTDAENIKLKGFDWNAVKPNGRHGATTARTKQYIDFAAKHGFDAVLVEGWNVGWEDWFGKWKEEVFDFVTPYPDFDVAELHRYAKEKGVKLIMHHETSGSATNYERRMDSAYSFMKANGYDAVKSGYVGKIIPRGEYHDGQWMVNHYIRAVEKAAQYRIMVDTHEPVRPTGLHRTYPNWLATEAARGMEYNAWSSGNPPEHETILPFTRLMGGPMDYTPGILRLKLDYTDQKKKEQVPSTIARQLALYVTIYSPLQMAADLPEHYEARLDAFQFIKDVAADWDDTQVLAAEPGDFVTIARKAKGRSDWFLGAVTDENERSSTVPLSFLDQNRTYVATVYADGPAAHYQKNPSVYTITKHLVTAGTLLRLKLAPGGGAAVRFTPATAAEEQQLKQYK
jgi:hypothetical protein